MAYQTGAVNSLADIQTVIQTFLTGNGWTWDAGSGTIYKDRMFVAFVAPTADKVLFLAKTALSGGTSAPYSCGMGSMARVATGNTPAPLTFPANYFAFLNGDEFYFVVKYDVVRFQYVMWGRSTVDLGVGATGTYISATVNSLQTSTYKSGQQSAINIGAGGNYGSNPYSESTRPAAPFWASMSGSYTTSESSTPNLNTGFVHNEVAGSASWVVSVQDTQFGYFRYVGNGYCGNLQGVLPNGWNGESPLLPIRAYKVLAESKVALVLDLQHARQCRVDNFNDAEVISIGADQWQVFPFHRKDLAGRDGGVNIDHTGTFGWAIRKVD